MKYLRLVFFSNCWRWSSTTNGDFSWRESLFYTRPTLKRNHEAMWLGCLSFYQISLSVHFPLSAVCFYFCLFLFLIFNFLLVWKCTIPSLSPTINFFSFSFMIPLLFSFFFIRFSFSFFLLFQSTFGLRSNTFLHSFNMSVFMCLFVWVFLLTYISVFMCLTTVYSTRWTFRSLCIYVSPWLFVLLIRKLTQAVKRQKNPLNT